MIGYGLAERVLPGVVDLDDVRAAFGRLAQPLTYWNAIGALAALGLILVARLAGDGSRAAGCGLRRGGAPPRRSARAWCSPSRAARSPPR